MQTSILWGITWSIWWTFLVSSKLILSKYAIFFWKKERKQYLDKRKNGVLKFEIDALKKNAHSSSCGLKAKNERLHKKVECLTIDLAKFVQGGENLDKLLGQQRCAYNKVVEHKNA